MARILSSFRPMLSTIRVARLSAPTCRFASISSEEAAALDEKLSSSNAEGLFKNIDLDDIRFEASENKNGELQPAIYSQDVPGLTFVTPFCVTGYCHFKHVGNFGVEKKFKSGTVVVDSLNKAEFELMLTSRPLLAGPSLDSNQNDQFVEMMQWLGDVRTKLQHHIAENLESYTQLSKATAFLSNADHETKLDYLNSIMAPIERPYVDVHKATWSSLALREKVYIKTKQEGREIRTYCREDEDMAAQGYSRRYLPVYDIRGNRVGVKDVDIRHGDCVAATIRVRPYIYNVAGNVGIKFGLDLKNVTKGRDRVTMASDNQTFKTNAPFGDMME